MHTLNNVKSTRAAFHKDFGRYTLRVCDLSLQIIQKYFHKFRETAAREFRFDPEADEKSRLHVAGIWSEWWKKNKKLITWNRREHCYEYIEQ